MARQAFQPGADVKESYYNQGSQKVVTAIEAQGAKTSRGRSDPGPGRFLLRSVGYCLIRVGSLAHQLADHDRLHDLGPGDLHQRVALLGSRSG
jgi:hypothetical protein